LEFKCLTFSTKEQRERKKGKRKEKEGGYGRANKGNREGDRGKEK